MSCNLTKYISANPFLDHCSLHGHRELGLESIFFLPVRSLILTLFLFHLPCLLMHFKYDCHTVSLYWYVCIREWLLAPTLTHINAAHIYVNISQDKREAFGRSFEWAYCEFLFVFYTAYGPVYLLDHISSSTTPTLIHRQIQVLNQLTVHPRCRVGSQLQFHLVHHHSLLVHSPHSLLAHSPH